MVYDWCLFFLVFVFITYISFMKIACQKQNALAAIDV